MVSQVVNEDRFATTGLPFEQDVDPVSSIRGVPLVREAAQDAKFDIRVPHHFGTEELRDHPEEVLAVCHLRQNLADLGRFHCDVRCL